MNKFILMAPPQQGQGGGEIWSTIIMFSFIILIFYFMILRPQNKKQKEKVNMINSIKKGDKVITAGGIHGTVSGIDEKTLLIEVADKVKLKLEKSSIIVVNKTGEVEAA